MDLAAQADAVRSATASISTCSPATSALLKTLLSVPDDDSSSAKPKAPRARAATSANAGARRGNAATAALAEKKELSPREKAALATQVVNTLIKTLGEATKPSPAPVSSASQPTQDDDLVKTATRSAFRRSFSCPATPLQSRSANEPSPVKNARPSAKSKNTAGLLAAAECARVALAALRHIHTTGKVSFPPLQLEAGMSAIVGKLVALGLHEQAVKEAWVLKQRLGGAPAKPEKKKGGKASANEPKNTTPPLPELLNFGDVKATGQELYLVITTQIQVLQILATANKPTSVEAALPYLTHGCKCSPINLLLRLVEEKSMDIGKPARLMERVVYYLLAMTPSSSSKEDSIAQESRLSASPEAAFELQALALEARLHWWKLAKRQGDHEKEILAPLSAYLAAFVRRSQSNGQAVYVKCHEAFVRLKPHFDSKQEATTRQPRSALARIYQTLATLARDAGQLSAAETWVRKIREGLCPKEDSAAKNLSVAAQLLSFHLKNPAKFLHDDELLSEVVSGIQGPLRGDSAELDELLTNVCTARRYAVNLLVTSSKGASGSDFTPLAKTMELLESLVLQCPRFCLRWLGKPPGPTSSTKDFLRYEQRRRLMQETIHNTLESAFMRIKTGLERKRLTWEAMGTILADCCTLLEYMGTLAVSDSTTSYYVKMSHFYYLQYYSLRQTTNDPKDPAPMRALRSSIECVKNRPAAEKEKAQFLLKSEKMAEVCIVLGRRDYALTALRAIRDSLVEEGSLKDITYALQTMPVCAAWKRNEKADYLSRTLSSIAKLESVWTDWTAELAEGEQAAALEHRLHFILLRGSKKQDEISLQHPTVDTLLRTYIPTRFPIRRFRVLIDLLCSDIGKTDRSELLAVARDAAQVDECGELGEDSGLQNYVRHMKAFYQSITALTDDPCDLSIVRQSVSTWRSLVNSCQSKTDLEKSIDNAAALLDHLQSMADFLRMRGQDSLLAMVLELSADISHLAEGPTSGDLVHHKTSLALQYSNLGRSSKAEQVFSAVQEYVDAHEAACIALANFHLGFAEHWVAIGNLKKAEEHLAQAQRAFDSDAQNRKDHANERKHIVIRALYLHSVVALERGDSHYALIYARESVKSLSLDWKRLERRLTSDTSPDTSMTADTSLSLTSGEDTTDLLRHCSGPEFWKLFCVLYRNLLRVSAIYAHLGMFQETIYYAEQAHRLANAAGSELYNSHSVAWMASMYAKSANPTKSLELLQAAGNVLPDDDEACYSSAALACQISSLYLDLKNYEGATMMLARAEAFAESLMARTKQATDIITLENKVADLTIEDKPRARPTKRAVRQPAVKRTTRTAVAAKPKTVVPKQVAVVEDVQLSKLRATILLQKAMSMLQRKDWMAARCVLQEASDASKLMGLAPTGQVTMAACLMGMSMDQMARDPVFSVIQESTISFPTVSCANDKQAAASPLKKGRGASSRDVSKEPTRAYVENLREAQQYLLQAHSVAAQSGDASLVHRISGMLQNIGLLLAATSVKARAATQSGHTSYSVELARNLTWRRERRAAVLEKNKPTFEAQNWPVPLASAMPKRTSLGFTLDLFKFQKEYIDIIPKPWTVISLSLSENNHDLCITKLQSGDTPFVIRLPLERASSRDADSDVFNFQQGRAELVEIINLANESCHSARDMTVKGDRPSWWQEREALDLRMRDLLENIEQIWLGGFRGIFSQHARRPDLLARFQKSFLNILDKHLPSRRQVRGKKTKAAQPSPVTLDSRIMELFVGLGDATSANCDFEEELTDLLYFVVDILQFHGETNAYDEIDFDSMVVDTFDALHSYHSAVKDSPLPTTNPHTILMLDKSLHVFPWESLPCLHNCAVSRMPSLACLRRLLFEQKDHHLSPRPSTPSNNHSTPTPSSKHPGRHLSFGSGTYILNPSNDLVSTQSTFLPPLNTHLPSSTWNRIVSRPPTESEFETALIDKDILLYFGHGSGAQYIRARTIRNLDRCRAAVLLMGCSSARLQDAGEFEVYGPAWNYMLAGCPAVVGTLWDVTDRDIDRFAGRLFEEWGLVPGGAFGEGEVGGGRGKGRGRVGKGKGKEKGGEDNAGKVSLVEAVARAREACKFRYVTAAAVAVYGIPVYVDKDGGV